MSKTPDEIKKGMECCITDKCRECPYYPLYEVYGCKLARAKDALALIQQLQADNAQQARCIENMTDKLNALNDEVAKLQAERDAAVEDLETVCGMFTVCHACKDRFWGGDSCRGCVNSNHWQWRGVQKEDIGA